MGYLFKIEADLRREEKGQIRIKTRTDLRENLLDLWKKGIF